MSKETQAPEITQETVAEKAPARIKIVGNAYVLTSKLPLETIKKVEKYDDRALCLIEVKHDEEREIFRIGTGKLGSISKCGIIFNEANKSGFATVTALFPEGVSNKKEFIKENFINILFMLDALENSIANAATQLETVFAEIENSIEEI